MRLTHCYLNYVLIPVLGTKVLCIRQITFLQYACFPTSYLPFARSESPNTHNKITAAVTDLQLYTSQLKTGENSP